MKKERFPEQKRSKLMHRGDGSFHIIGLITMLTK
jgi:hypothetical protein